MQQETVSLLLNELTALRGVVRQINIRVLALERVLQLDPALSTVYQQRLEEIEKDPKSLFPLEGLEDLREALLQDHA